jgi:hypothetical protein
VSAIDVPAETFRDPGQTEVRPDQRIRLAYATNLLSTDWGAAVEKSPHRRPSWCPPIPAQFRRASISINKKAAQPASERDDVLTYISAKPTRQDVETLPANDNERAALADLSFLDVINDEDEVADIARRAERLGHATLIAMAIGLAAVPLLYLMLA